MLVVHSNGDIRQQEVGGTGKWVMCTGGGTPLKGLRIYKWYNRHRLSIIYERLQYIMIMLLFIYNDTADEI